MEPASATGTKTSPRPATPVNLIDFARTFRDEWDCARYLELIHWPDGFVCPKCAVAEVPFRFPNRPRVLRCRSCAADTSLTAGTVMHRSKQPLEKWFWAAYLVTTSTPGVSALEIQKKLGISRYETAFQLLHKLRAGMVRPDRDRIGSTHAVELDIAWVGGKHKGKGEPGTYRKTKKVAVVVAVEVLEGKPPAPDELTRSGKPKEQRFFAGRVRLQVAPNKSAKTLAKFAQDCVAPGALVISDAGAEFSSLTRLGYKHAPLPLRGVPDSAEAWVPLVHLVIGN